VKVAALIALVLVAQPPSRVPRSGEPRFPATAHIVAIGDLDRDVRDGLRAGGRVGGDLGAGGGLGRSLDGGERGLAVDLAVAVDTLAVAREALVGAGLAGGPGIGAVLGDDIGRGIRLGLAAIWSMIAGFFRKLFGGGSKTATP